MKKYQQENQQTFLFTGSAAISLCVCYIFESTHFDVKVIFILPSFLHTLNISNVQLYHHWIKGKFIHFLFHHFSVGFRSSRLPFYVYDLTIFIHFYAIVILYIIFSYWRMTCVINSLELLLANLSQSYGQIKWNEMNTFENVT